MKTVRAGAAYLPQMKALWQTCFGDDEAFVSRYYARFGADNGAAVLDGTTVCAMLQWLSVPYVQPDGDVQKGAYFYAVCTAPEYRNRGCCRALLSFAERLLRAEGYDFVFLYPAGEGLVPMYEKLGYRMTLTHAEREVCAQPQPQTERKKISAEDYFNLRRMLLWADFADWQLPAIAYQSAQGDLLSLTDGSRLAIAAVERHEGELFVKEYLGDYALAGAIPAYYGSRTAALRTVGETPCAMTKPLTDKPLPHGYTGFVFD